MELETVSIPGVDEKYTIIQNMFLKGDDIQKLSIIQTLPQLVKIDQQATFTRIVPKIQQELPKASAEFQITTSQIFRVLIEKKVPINLLSAVIQGVDSKDPLVSSAWMDTLLAVTPYLGIETIKRDIIPLISTKSQLSQPVIQRVAACRIIGKIANHKNLNSNDIKKDILPFVHSLCQDCSVEVRAIMCVQLPAVAEGLTAPLVKANLLPSYIELASDTSPLVREAAVLTIVNLLPFLEKDVLETTVVPLIKRFCEKTIPDDSTAAIISSQFGRIIKFLANVLNNDNKMWFLNYYKVLSRKGFDNRVKNSALDASKDVICRENCATNLPAVSEFVKTGIPSQIDFLYTIFRDLAGDPCYIVRKAVAGCIHDTTKVLVVQCKTIKADIVRLLRDDAEDVLQMLVPKLSVTLQLLAQNGYLSRDRTDQTTMEICRALLKCQIELSKGYNWRLLVMFLEQMECLPKCIPGDFIHQHFSPMILGTATNGRVKPIVQQATKTLLVFLRYNPKANQQKWIRDSLINQFCYSDSCYTRQTFVKICFAVLEVFSSKYFKEYFFIPLLCLASDRVSNVRYSFLTILPKLKLITLCPPLDPKHKILLQEAIQKLESQEKTAYVLNLLRTTLKQTANMSIATNKDFYSKDLIKQEEEASGCQITATVTAGGAAKPKPAAPVGTPPPQGKAPPVKPGPPSAVTPSRTGPPLQVTASKTGPPVQIVPSKTGPPMKAPPNQQSVDMSILEQHFYIDAGVVLPETLVPSDTETIDTKIETILPHIPTTANHRKSIRKPILTMDTIEHPSIVSDNFSDVDIHIIESITPNMTDDVKVNLRKIGIKSADNNDMNPVRSKSSIPILNHSNITDNDNMQGSATTLKRNKRHSSVFSASCLETGSKNLYKRHSLSFQAGECSKIPICTRSKSFQRNSLTQFLDSPVKISNEIEQIEGKVSEIYLDNDDNVSKDETVTDNDDNTQLVCTKSSGLPILIRKRK